MRLFNPYVSKSIRLIIFGHPCHLIIEQRVGDSLTTSSRCEDFMASQPANASGHVFNHEATSLINIPRLWKTHSSPRYTTRLYFKDSAWINEVCSGWYKSVLQNSWHKGQNCPDYYLLSPPRERRTGHPGLCLLHSFHGQSLHQSSPPALLPLAWCRLRVASRRLTLILYLLFFPFYVTSIVYKSWFKKQIAP